ncbi:type II toxin-antitoxin system RelE/ParE family toxin [Candidatus Haliotispira prima]|uniref:Type II toxin-antitoxin system RelE/ParE family toxin n=1 Tax=Candidatus Haliotispira prima TaxID=3034016 RepID=A0ABY8MI98_9SPIO|nr:type II toxin-antitoxin system RelE/ParE family toxin [Candidatus Haliotispira prima]
MTYDVIATPKFKRDFKKIVKKYRSLEQEYFNLVAELEQNPEKGIDIGQNCFKIRLAIKSKGKGKSGGGRVITYFTRVKETVYLLTIYDKSEKDNITDSQIRELLDELPEME